MPCPCEARQGRPAQDRSTRLCTSRSWWHRLSTSRSWWHRLSSLCLGRPTGSPLRSVRRGPRRPAYNSWAPARRCRAPTNGAPGQGRPVHSVILADRPSSRWRDLCGPRGRKRRWRRMDHNQGMRPAIAILRAPSASPATLPRREWWLAMGGGEGRRPRSPRGRRFIPSPLCVLCVSVVFSLRALSASSVPLW